MKRLGPCGRAFVFMLALAGVLSAQGWTNGGTAPITGLPFTFAPGVRTAGWYLNTQNDGVMNFGEMGTDLGGGGATFADPRVTYTPVMFRVTPKVFVSPDGLYSFNGFYRVGRIFGKEIRIIDPGTPIGTPPPEWGRLARWFEISIPPTRAGNQHTAGPASFFEPPVDKFFLRGALVGQVVDLRSEHPLIETAQNSLFLSEIARRQFGRAKVIVSGGSYGSAAALVLSLTFPDRFDGCFGAGGAFDFSEYEEWNQVYRITEESQGRFALSSVMNADIDQTTTVFGWRQKTPWNLNLNSAAGLAQVRVPTMIVYGGCDGNQISNGQVDEIMAKAKALGMTGYFQAIELPEGGHALKDPFFPPCTGSSDTVFAEKFIAMVENFRGPAAGLVPPGAMPYARNGKYDSFLLEAKQSTIQTAPYAPAPITLEDRLGGPTMTGDYNGAAVLRGDTVYFGDRAGFVYKRTWNSAATLFTENWRAFAGMAVRSVAVADVGGQTLVFVGSARGLTVLDEATGQLVREKGPLTGGYGDVRTIAVGQILPGATGKQVAYMTLRMKLVIEDAATGQTLHTQEIGFVTDLIARGGTPPRLYASLARGHVVAFEFNGSGPWTMNAAACSPYLETTPGDIDFMTVGGAGDVVVAVPLSFGASGPLAYFLDAATLGVRSRFLVSGPALAVSGATGAARITVSASGIPTLETRAFSGALLNSIPLTTRRVAFRDPQTAGVPEFIGFGEADGSIAVYDIDTSNTPVGFVPGRVPTVAATHYLKTSGTQPKWQASLWRRIAERNTVTHVGVKSVVDTWDVTYDSAASRWRLTNPQTTGVSQADYYDGNPAHDTPGNEPSYKYPPTILLRTGDDETNVQNFTTLAHAGGRAPFGGTQDVFYDSTAGRVTAPPVKRDLADYGVAIGTPPAQLPDLAFGSAYVTENEDRRQQNFPPPSYVSRAGYDFWSMDGWPTAIDYVAASAAKMIFPDIPGGCPPGPQWGILASSAGGTLHAIDCDLCNLTANSDPSGMHYAVRRGLGRCMMAVTTDDVTIPADGISEYVYAGSLLRDAAQDTLWVMAPNLAPLASADAGAVTGVVAAGSLFQNSPSRELIVGGANGDIAVWSFNPGAATQPLRLVHRENLGVLFVGARKSMQVMRQPNGDILVGCAVDGGYMLLKLDPARMVPVTW